MINLTTPVGRLVQGRLYERTAPPAQTGQPQKLGPDGQPRKSWFFALAIAKNDPAWPAFRAKLDAESRTAWPQFFDAVGNLIHPTFANKITDGDAVDRYGKPNAGKEGFAGHWVVKFVSHLENGPRVLEWSPQMGAWIESTTAKIGDYASVNFDYESNKAAGTNTPGMYANPRQIAFERPGAAIEQQDSGPTANEAFGARGSITTGAPPPPAATPPPPAAAPVMTVKAGGKTYEAFIAAGWNHAALVEQGYVAAAPPYPDFMPNAADTPPPPPVETPPPPPATGPTMLPKAAGKTYEAFIAAGWNHAQLVSNGYVAA